MSVDLRDELPDVRAQGDRPTCLAFAVTAIHEFSRTKAGEDSKHLSEEALYWSCKKKDGNWQGGTSFDSAEEVLEEWGQPPEEMWPYDASRDDSREYQPPKGVREGSEDWFRCDLPTTAKTIDNIKASLVDRRPVVIGLQLTGGFYTPTGGKIPEPQPGEDLFGGHAVGVVGFQDDKKTGHLIIRNSWGPDWGDNGYGLLPYGYLEKLGIEARVGESRSEAKNDTDHEGGDL